MSEFKGTTRLAPSPTGTLHLGNVRTFVVNYALAVQNQWRVLMRIEDIQSPRAKPGAIARMLEELKWIGLVWDGDITVQSARGDIYEQALQKLAHDGHAYRCFCSRRDIKLAASAPHGDDGVTTYPGTCRNLSHASPSAKQPAWRVKVADRAISFTDRFTGGFECNLSGCGGDFVICRNNGLAAYQLAVVVDDNASGVNRIVRGDDLLDSTVRQIHLRNLLGYENNVEYWHVPLVKGQDGRRLAKRHGDTRLAYYRQKGAAPQKVLGLVAYWSGVLDKRGEISMPEFIRKFDVNKLPSRPVIFSKKDDDFLSRSQSCSFNP